MQEKKIDSDKIGIPLRKPEQKHKTWIENEKRQIKKLRLQANGLRKEKYTRT